MRFRCNICGTENDSGGKKFSRDEAGCVKCGSPVRVRAMICALSVELFGTAVALPEFPRMKSIRGLGFSDVPEYAELLAEKFDYRNTYYHQAPFLDASAIAAGESAQYDFVLANEIFEHVRPPVAELFDGVMGILKPSGVLVMTVPYSLEATTKEHFPELGEYNIVPVGERAVLVNRTAAGEWQVFDDLVFHGGAGSTAELRLYSESGLREELQRAGCGYVRFVGEECAPFGVLHEGNWGLPVVAGRTRFRMARESVAELVELYVAETRELTGECGRLDGFWREATAEIVRLNGELRTQGAWSIAQDQELMHGRAEVVRLMAHQDELRSWAMSEAQEIEWLTAELARATADYNAHSQELTEEVLRLRGVLRGWAESRWVKLGRRLGMGPEVE